MIFKLGIVFACVMFSVYANPAQPPSNAGTRIVGGYKVTNMAETPYQVSLRIWGRHSCGATILDGTHVITAAHCCFSNKKILPPSAFTVLVGSLKNLNTTSPNSTLIKSVKYVFTHTKYDQETLVNDIAVLRINGNFNFTSTVQNLKPAKKMPSDSTLCKISGWGSLRQGGFSSVDLYAAQVPIVDKSTCKKAYTKSAIKPGMFCAGYMQGGIDSCQGDSGGPFACNGSLVGIVSWGRGCAQAGYPGVYTDVSDFSKWISKQQSRSTSAMCVVSILAIATTVFSLIF